MATRARQLLDAGNEVYWCDMEIGQTPIDYLDAYEIWPTGNHPSAFIQQQAATKAVTDFLDHGNIDIKLQLEPEQATTEPERSFLTPSLYRAHNWLAWGSRYSRYGYATLAASAGCPYDCSFCTIHEWYNTKYQQRDPSELSMELAEIVDSGGLHLKMMDELLVNKSGKFRQLLDILNVEFPDLLNIWGYARVDSLPDDATLDSMKTAGINWVCLGIESGSHKIRKSMNKGSFTNQLITEAVKRLKDHGIAVLGNFMIGFPDDTWDTLEETRDMVYNLQCEYTNIYCATPYPDTELATIAADNDWVTPKKPIQFAQYSPQFVPTQTHTISGPDVLWFRDKLWHDYHSNGDYISLIDDTFGDAAASDAIGMTEDALHRNVLGGTYHDWIPKCSD